MQLSHLLATAAIIALRLSPCRSQNLLGAHFMGDGTFYGNNGGAGACSFQFNGAANLPWSTGTNVRVAMNPFEFASSVNCGQCLAFRGTGSGIGGTPISGTVQYALASNLCPECRSGDLDFEANGDGRWGIGWDAVQCDVGSSSMYYSFQGSNPFYLKLQAVNHRVPVHSMELLQSGVYTFMTRTNDNYFTLQSNGGVAFSLPTMVRLTSVLGDVVTDQIPTIAPTGTLLAGSAQFPLHTSYMTVGQGLGPSPPPLGPTTVPGTTIPVTSGPTTAVPPTPPVTVTPITLAPFTTMPPPITTPSPTTMQPPTDSQSPSTTQPASTTPPPTTIQAVTLSPTPQPSGTTAALPTPTPISTADPSTIPTTMPSNPSATSAPTSTTLVTAATSPPGTPVPTSSAPPTSSNCTAVMSGGGSTGAGSPSSMVCALDLQPYSQCGGRGNLCPSICARTCAPCYDAPFDGACCPDTFSCQRNNEWYWQCLPLPTACMGGPSGSVAQFVGLWSQCGGLGVQCAGSQCQDAPWEGVSCLGRNNRCVKLNPYYYQCIPGNTNVF